MPKEMSNPILVLNSGSSSLKFGVFTHSDGEERLFLSGAAKGIGRGDGTLHIKGGDGTILLSRDHLLETQTDALGTLASVIQQHLHVEPVAVAHRIVHGGPHLREHQRITDNVMRQLEEAVSFAPLHIPPALAILHKAEEIFADQPHFACFDTAFHRTMPEVAARLPLPQRYYEQGVMRFGFHGLSYEYLVHRLGAELPKRAIFAHLGNGASVTAILDGRSIDTSMGLTPTGGVPMGTRTGDLDPGVLLHLLRTEAPTVAQLERLLNQESGLAGFSGGESDMQDLERCSAAGDARAALAIEAFCLAIRKQIGAYAALLGGVDLLVFTGGIGEHSAHVRNLICDGLGFLALKDKIRVMKTEEEVQMARHCRTLLQPLSSGKTAN